MEGESAGTHAGSALPVTVTEKADGSHGKERTGVAGVSVGEVRRRMLGFVRRLGG